MPFGNEPAVKAGQTAAKNTSDQNGPFTGKWKKHRAENTANQDGKSVRLLPRIDDQKQNVNWRDKDHHAQNIRRQ